jgi:type I restriction enzyme R subunit
LPDLTQAPAIPAHSPPASEDATSQIPALDLLQQLGWSYLSPGEVDRLRGGRRSEVLLKGVLREQLAKLNRFESRGRKHAFTEGAIEDALHELAGMPDDGLVRTNEKLWDLLRLGKSVPQTIDGDRRSYTLQYVDWEHPDRNVFHVTEEFAVEAAGSTETRRPDLVGFVNGIPFLVAECKPSSLPGGKVPVEEAISQQLRNQGGGEIPRLFHFAQLLLALAVNEARYGATGTPLRFWQGWRERDAADDAELVRLRGPRPVIEIAELGSELERSSLRTRNPGEVNAYLDSLVPGREVTAQDRLLYALCRPVRLLEIMRHFTVFDAGERKVARYQQYFCVKDTIERVRQMGLDGTRAGGVVWHTQGSGKSLTMVMLADAIIREFGDREPRVILVTDRVDLDDQIYGTFHGSGVDLVQAETGLELRRLLTDRRSKVVTTLVHKFLRALSSREPLADDADIFVLVDEGHRTHSGVLHVAMRTALPKASYVGFTGTPILKGDRETVARFGGIIGEPYTIDQAVEDRAVVPLVYEGRHVPQNIDEQPIDAWFEKYTAALTDEQKLDLKRKYSTADQLNRAEQKIRAIAWDISVHFRTSFQGRTPFKGQLVAPSKADALLYKKYLDEFAMVSSEVLISAPDTREGHLDVDEVDDTANRPNVLDFWARTLKRFGSEDNYRKDVISRFKSADEPEIIIVVDMLLTGFDAPRNAVLYLTRALKEHTLLQAIARVNRVYEGKDYGLVVDYYGVLGHLDEALDLYTAFGGQYDPEDLAGVLTDIRKEIDKLPQKHAELWDVFKTVPNKHDQEAMERFLADEDRRAQFYQAVGAYARILKLAVSSVAFHADTPPEKVQRYRDDFKYFGRLRASVARRYAEAVDFRQYEGPIQKLLDTFVGADEVKTIVQPVDIFDRDAFKREVEQFASPEAKAEVIANRLRHTIHEHLEEDPVFYRKLSEMLKEAYERYERERFEQLELLRQVEQILERAQNRERFDDAPPVLTGRPIARTYYDVVDDALADAGAAVDRDATAGLALAIDDVIERLKIVSWESNADVQNRMRTAIEDELFRFKTEQGVELSFDYMDRIIETCIEVARRRSARA